MLRDLSVSPPRRLTSRFLPGLCLLAALAWTIPLRIPLVLNAQVHLDSDLAVDGLTLLEAVRGDWRWHYPGTPFSGTLPVFLSYLQARLWGVNPETLVSGGVVAQVLLILAVFGLAGRCFGPRAAAGSLVPLTFASTGMLWLSGRITGGHLPVVAWSATAWWLLTGLLRGRGKMAVAVFGAWCGLGVYLDSMFMMTLAGMGVTTAGSLVVSSRLRHSTRPTWGKALALVLGFLAGASPAYLGRWFDPYDAYHEQFAATLEPAALAAHGRILLLDCLPRLIAGHRLPGLEADPDPRLLGLGAPLRQDTSSRQPNDIVALTTTVLALGCFALALLALAWAAGPSSDLASRTVALGLLVTLLAVSAGFLINRNIYNADNYRYLVLLLIPWALGFGLLLDRILKRPGLDRWLGVVAVLALAALFTADALAWYRRMGWIDGRLAPVQRPLDDPALRWLADHPEVRSILGGYWDVYRLSFLTGGVVRGVPYSVYPNRYPEWSRDLPQRRPETLLVRESPEGRWFLDAALRGGGEVLDRRRGLTIVRWPWNDHPPPTR